MSNSLNLTYKQKKALTIIFLLLTFLVPIIGVIGVILMWFWMNWNKWIKVIITLPYVFIFILSPMIILSYLFVLRPVQISGEAMSPNYTQGQYYMTNVLSSNEEVQKGDVVIFTAPGNQDMDYIKRIIALPNERILIQNGQIYINGEQLDESKYLATNVLTQTNQGGFIEEGKEYVIPAGSYFVLGDNRMKSEDSRYFGPIKREDIKSKIAFCYWKCW